MFESITSPENFTKEDGFTLAKQIITRSQPITRSVIEFISKIPSIDIAFMPMRAIFQVLFPIHEDFIPLEFENISWEASNGKIYPDDIKVDGISVCNLLVDRYINKESVSELKEKYEEWNEIRTSADGK